jgi:beta-aspartyl-peptidase (threonine type)
MRSALRFAALGAVLLAGSGLAQAWAQRAPQWSIVLHGGAGVIERGKLSPEGEARYRAALQEAVELGGRALQEGRSALDVAELVVRRLEDDPLFNAGVGAVFTAEGRNELDASIMDGRTRSAGAVAGLTRVRHPISAARAVMEKSSHVMLSGAGAEAFAQEQGLEMVEPGYFYTQRRWDGLVEALTARGLPIPAKPAGAAADPAAPGGRTQAEPPLGERKFGTVGVAVRDSKGDLAAATSTGGVTAKRWGRIGDSPVIGAGTYAQNGVCAVSATGSGEFFIRASVAHAICARVALKGESIQAAADAVVQQELRAMGGDGGVIALGPAGEPVWSFNTSGMYRARWRQGGRAEVAIYQDER